MIFNQRARNLRENMNLSQEYIAKKLNISRATVNRYENDKFELKLSYAIELAKIYNVSLDYLTGLIDEPRKLKEYD